MKASSALLVIDMQRGFLEDGHPLFCGEEARRIIPLVSKLVEEALGRGTPVFFSADAHDPNDREFKIFPPHCIKGTSEAEIIPELAVYLDRSTLIETSSYSAFFATDLHERLQEAGVRDLNVCGVCTDICVMHTVADAYYRGYGIEVRRDCVASFDRDAHTFALRHMKSVFGARITGGE